MGLPRKLKNFAVFVDGNNYMGEVPEVTLPTLKRKTEEYRGGGMNGPVTQDFGQEAMEMQLKGAGWISGLMRQWGAGTHDAVLLRFAGAVQADDTEAVQAVEIVGRGRLIEMDPGNAKAGEGTERTYKFALSYFKQTVDGEVELEIDLVNMIEMVHGEDRLSATRAALGV
jgi:P2 family phage contractile tail tube protein